MQPFSHQWVKRGLKILKLDGEINTKWRQSVSWLNAIFRPSQRTIKDGLKFACKHGRDTCHSMFTYWLSYLHMVYAWYSPNLPILLAYLRTTFLLCIEFSVFLVIAGTINSVSDPNFYESWPYETYLLCLVISTLISVKCLFSQVSFFVLYISLFLYSFSFYEFFVYFCFIGCDYFFSY